MTSTIPDTEQNCGQHEKRVSGHWYGKPEQWCNGRPTRKEK